MRRCRRVPGMRATKQVPPNARKSSHPSSARSARRANSNRWRRECSQRSPRVPSTRPVLPLGAPRRAVLRGLVRRNGIEERLGRPQTTPQEPRHCRACFTSARGLVVHTRSSSDATRQSPCIWTGAACASQARRQGMAASQRSARHGRAQSAITQACETSTARRRLRRAAKSGAAAAAVRPPWLGGT